MTAAPPGGAGRDDGGAPIRHQEQRFRYCNLYEEHKGFCGTDDNMSTMLRINRDKCGYCGTCVAVCPEDALELIDAYLSLERECIACGICARACPLGALEVVHEE